jgi:hypothetical protein
LKIFFEQSGGIAGLSRKITIDTNSLPSAEVQEIKSIVDRSKFYELPSSTIPQSKNDGGAADYFKYKITLESDTGGSNAHTVETTDITMPPELSPFITYLRRKAKEQNRVSK